MRDGNKADTTEGNACVKRNTISAFWYRQICDTELVLICQDRISRYVPIIFRSRALRTGDPF